MIDDLPTRIGKYYVTRILGRGGMGIVYLAEDRVINRQVAIKTLGPGLFDDIEMQQRFYREAMAAGALSHRNIVTVYDVGQEDGRSYIVMEYVSGEPLAEIIKARRPMSLIDKLTIIQQVCSALGYAHAHGVLHRDVEPSNVIVQQDSLLIMNKSARRSDTPISIKVLNFGIARVTELSMSRDSIGGLIGNINYMAPELALGQPFDGRSDIFSTGIVLFQLLTGELPFAGKGVEVLNNVLKEPHPPLNRFLSNSPRELDAIIDRALAKDPNQRYATAEEFGFDLNALIENLLRELKKPVEGGNPKPADQRSRPSVDSLAPVAPPFSSGLPSAMPTESIAGLGPEAAALAEAVSLAIRIEPQLLRKMRIDLFPAWDAGVEADVWFSSAVRSRTASGMVLQQSIAEVLRQRLGKKPAVLEAAWGVIKSLHRDLSPAIFAEEKLAYLALSGRYDEARNLLRSVVATLVSPRGRGLADWATKAVERLPNDARSLEEAQMLAFGAGLRLGEGRLPGSDDLPGEAANWAAWIAPGDLDTLPFGVTLLEDAVEFGPVGRSGSHRIDLPKTTPVVVQVGWHDGARDRTERTMLSPDRVTIVEFGPGVTQVDLRTVLGDSYWLTVPARRERESLQKKIHRVRPPRVQITYDIETGGAIQKRELPFVVAVLGNLSGAPIATPFRDRRFAQIDRDNFNAVMKNVKPQLGLRVTNLLRQGTGDLHVELSFETMEDFEPAAMARQIGPTRELLGKRSKLAEIRSLISGNESLENELEGILQENPPSESTEQSPAELALRTALQALENSRATVGIESSRLYDLAAALVENVPFTKGSNLEQSLNGIIHDLDAQLSAQMSAILHDSNFQALEAMWRGLRYLVMQTETSTLLKIRVLNLTKQELERDLTRNANFYESIIFKKLHEEPYGMLGGEPFGLLIGAYEFGRSAADVALLELLSGIAGASLAPFIASASASLLELDSFAELDNPRDLRKVFESPSAIRWNSLRDSEDAKYLGLTMPHILLRLPYGREFNPVEEFDFEEDVNSSRNHSQYLWGNSAFALAACVTNAFARYNWCAAIKGVESGGLVEGLPAHNFVTDSGDFIRGPVEIAITDRRETELAQMGLIPLCFVKAYNEAAFFSVNGLHKPRSYASEEAVESAQHSVQLAYLFCICRFAQYMKCMLRDKIGSFMSREHTERFLNNWIANYVSSDDNAPIETKAKFPLREARIDVEEVKDIRGTYRATAYLRPHFQVDNLTVSLRVIFDV